MFVSRRQKDQEKRTAQTFFQFLEKQKRKKDMSVEELRTIYDELFRPWNETSVTFSRVLNALTYHLNLCQQIKDRVVFGGGEKAALQLFTREDTEESSDEEDSSLFAVSYFNLNCKVCKKDFGSKRAQSDHFKTIKHRQQLTLKKIRKSLDK